jgi:hypothetical protein
MKAEGERGNWIPLSKEDRGFCLPNRPERHRNLSSARVQSCMIHRIRNYSVYNMCLLFKVGIILRSSRKTYLQARDPLATVNEVWGRLRRN